MTEKSRKFLSDVLMAIDLINEFTVAINDFNVYEKKRTEKRKVLLKGN